MRFKWVVPGVLLICAGCWLVIGDGAYRLTHNGKGPGIVQHLVKRPAARAIGFFEREG